MVETNPPRNNQPETHPDDERGRWPERFSPPSDGEISPCLGKLIEMAAARRQPCCSGKPPSILRDCCHLLLSSVDQLLYDLFPPYLDAALLIETSQEWMGRVYLRMEEDPEQRHTHKPPEGPTQPTRTSNNYPEERQSTELLGLD